MSHQAIAFFVLLTVSVIFLLTGLSMLIFGSKTHEPNSESPKIELTVGDKKVVLPYAASVFSCVVGVILVVITLSIIITGGDAKSSTDRASIISTAHAQKNVAERPATIRWAYFGHEGSPKLWNFQIMNGTYDKLFSSDKSKLLLRAVRNVTTRHDHYTALTGSLLNFLSPPPPSNGQITEGDCIKVIDSVNVGVNKIWLQVEKADCKV